MTTEFDENPDRVLVKVRSRNYGTTPVKDRLVGLYVWLVPSRSHPREGLWNRYTVLNINP